MRLETDRLIVDPFRESDKEDYFHCVTHDRKVLKTFVCPYTNTPEELNFAPYLASTRMFAIRLKDTGRAIGIILHFNETADACEIGYAIGSDYWNMGYTTEAAKAFIGYCFEALRVKRIEASFFTGNIASRRVMEKCGMSYDRFAEKAMTYLGEEKDLTYYCVTSDPSRA